MTSFEDKYSTLFRIKRLPANKSLSLWQAECVVSLFQKVSLPGVLPILLDSIFWAIFGAFSNPKHINLQSGSEITFLNRNALTSAQSIARFTVLVLDVYNRNQPIPVPEGFNLLTFLSCNQDAKGIIAIILILGPRWYAHPRVLNVSRILEFIG